MPKIEYGGPRVGPTSLGNRVGTSSPLIGAGEGSTQAADALFDTAQKIHAAQKDDAFQIANQEILGKLSQKEAELRVQLRKSEGKNALTAKDQILGDFDKFYADLEKNGMGDERLKRVAKQHYDRHRTNLYKDGEGYAAGQMEIVDENDFKTGMAAERDNGLNSLLTDPSYERYQQAVQARHALVRGRMKRRGQSEEASAYAAKAALSEMDLGAIKTLVDNGQDLKAAEFYKTANLTDEDNQRATSLLELGSTLGESMRIVDRLRGSGKKETEIDEEIAKIENPKIRRAAEQRNDDVRRRTAQAKQADYEVFANDAFKTVDDRIRPGNSPMEEVGPSVWDGLEPQERNSITALWKRKTAPVEPENDWGKYTQFSLMSAKERANLSPQQLATQYRPFMDDVTYKWAVQEVDKSRKAGDLYTDEQNVFRALQGANVNGIDWRDTMESVRDNPTKAATFGKFSTLVRNLYIQNKAETPEEKQKILDGLMLKVRANPRDEVFGMGAYMGPGNPVKTGKTLYDERRLFELTAADRIPIEDINKADLEVYENQIKAAEMRHGWKFKDRTRLIQLLRSAHLSGNRSAADAILNTRD